MMPKFAIRLAVAAVLMTATSGAFAQEFSKEHLASAKAAIDAAHLNDSLDNILVNTALQAKNLFIKNNPSLSAQIDEVTNKVAIEMATRRPDLDKQIYIIWATKFTKPELDEIARFYSSAVGKKAAAETANISRATMQTIGTWQTKLSEDMVSKVREEMKKRGYNL